MKKEYHELKTDDEIAEDILHIHFTSAEEVADKVMYDLLNKVKPGDVNRADVSHGREDVEAVNKRFNEELAELTVENAQSKRLKLGSPSSMLSSAGVPDKPIILYGNKLLKKARLHGFEIEDLHDLPLAMQHPIAVFEGSHINSFATLLELKLRGHNTLVSIEVNKKGEADFNIISSLFGNENKGVIKWILDGKLLSVDKAKAQSYISASALNANATYKNELSSVAKIVEDFENPVIKGENFSGEEENNSMKDAPTTPTEAEDVAKQVELKVGNYGEMAAGDGDTRGYTTTGGDGALGRAGRASVEQAVADVDKRTGGNTAVIDSSEVPADVVKKLGEGVKGYVKGGKAYVVADNCDSAAEAATVAVHESAGHINMRNYLGDKAGEFYQSVFDNVMSDADCAAWKKATIHTSCICICQFTCL